MEMAFLWISKSKISPHVWARYTGIWSFPSNVYRINFWIVILSLQEIGLDIKDSALWFIVFEAMLTPSVFNSCLRYFFLLTQSSIKNSNSWITYWSVKKE
jgi:hypothetical protein